MKSVGLCLIGGVLGEEPTFLPNLIMLIMLRLTALKAKRMSDLVVGKVKGSQPACVTSPFFTAPVHCLGFYNYFYYCSDRSIQFTVFTSLLNSEHRTAMVSKKPYSSPAVVMTALDSA